VLGHARAVLQGKAATVAAAIRRKDITGARWGLEGAETILKLRALISNGDFPEYWTYHLTQEQQHIHNSRYLGGAIPDG
jgi:hypothetical protein